MGGDIELAVEDDADAAWGCFVRVLKAFEELGIAFVEELGQVARYRSEFGVYIAFDGDGEGFGLFGRLIFGGGLQEDKEENRHVRTFDGVVRPFYDNISIRLEPPRTPRRAEGAEGTMPCHLHYRQCSEHC